MERLERQILLQLPLNRLPLQRTNPYIKRAIGQLKRELKRRGLTFVPHIWISNDWFCPDGVCGFAIPFYLFHETLLKMEREKMGYAEGENYSQLLKLLRHETGHAFENYYGARSHPLRRKFFGLSHSHEYPASYQPVLFSSHYIHHLGEGYAQSHPDEDFAETFATWLAMPKMEWSKKYRQKKSILRKLEAIEKIVKDCQTRAPLKRCSYKEFEPVDKDKRTLQEYFQEKTRRLKPSASQESKRILKSLASERGARKSVSLHALMQKNREKIVNELSHNLGVYKYQAEKMIKPLEREIKLSQLLSHRSEGEVVKNLFDAATVEALEAIRLKKDRFYL